MHDGIVDQCRTDLNSRVLCAAIICRGPDAMDGDKISPMPPQLLWKPDIFTRRSFNRRFGRAHAPITTCLAECNPRRPTRIGRSERRLRHNRGLTRQAHPVGIGLPIMIASATIPQCFYEYQRDFLGHFVCCVAAALDKQSDPSTVLATRSRSRLTGYAAPLTFLFYFGVASQPTIQV